MSLLKSLFGLFTDTAIDSEPSVNVDGTPMCGSVDINGNPYGVTEVEPIEITTCDTDSFSSDFSDTFSCDFDDSFSSGMDDW